MTTTLQDMQNHNIVIVDDTPANLRLLVEILSKQGYYARPVTNGARALAAILAEPADLILLDIKMPEMSGYDVCQALKADQRTREIPVIFISALDDIRDKVKGFEMGGVDYITKPFQAKEVLARVEIHLTLHMLQRNLEELVVRRTQELQQRNTQLEEKNRALQQAKEALQQAKKAVEVANQAKNEFIANISHELRTPLNHVLGFAQILDENPSLTETQKGNVEIILQSGEHLLLIIKDLIDLSTLEAGQMMLNVVLFHLPLFLKNLTKMFQLQATQQHIAFETDFADDVPQLISGDEKRLRQILLNLLGNAIKFTQGGKVIFRVYELHELHELKNSQIHKFTNSQIHKLRFEVEDTGVGIPPDQLDRIFGAFHQIGNKLLAQTEGIGLGLTISQRLCRMMGCELQVNSSVGQGSRFWFDLDVPSDEIADVFTDAEGLDDLALPPDLTEETLLLPEIEVLKHLYKLTKLGDVFALRRHIDDIETNNAQYIPFTRTIRQWAQNLNIPAIQRFLEQYIERY